MSRGGADRGGTWEAGRAQGGGDLVGHGRGEVGRGEEGRGFVWRPHLPAAAGADRPIASAAAEEHVGHPVRRLALPLDLKVVEDTRAPGARRLGTLVGVSLVARVRLVVPVFLPKVHVAATICHAVNNARVRRPAHSHARG